MLKKNSIKMSDQKKQLDIVSEYSEKPKQVLNDELENLGEFE